MLRIRGQSLSAETVVGRGLGFLKMVTNEEPSVKGVGEIARQCRCIARYLVDRRSRDDWQHSIRNVVAGVPECSVEVFLVSLPCNRGNYLIVLAIEKEYKLGCVCPSRFLDRIHRKES